MIARAFTTAWPAIAHAPRHGTFGSATHQHGPHTRHHPEEMIGICPMLGLSSAHHRGKSNRGGKLSAPKTHNTSTLSASGIRRILTEGGERVTFFVVTRAEQRDNTMAGLTSSAEKNSLEAPVSQGFHKRRRALEKITAGKTRFEHACCIRTHMDYKRTTGSGCLSPIKTVAGLPDGDSSVLPGTLFYRCKKAHEQRESCQSGCVGTVNLRHPASHSRQRRKEAERLNSQVSPTWSA